MSGAPQSTGEVFIFFRKEGWYPVTLRSAKEVPANVDANPGTLRVEDAGGRVIWKELSTH